MKSDQVAACRFFSAEDVCRWALSAYYGASRALVPPNGEAFIAEGCAWSSAACFAFDVHRRLTESMVAAAIDAKIPCNHWSESASCSWDDSGFPGSHADYVVAHFAGLELNDLPPLDNPGNNRSDGGLRHG